MNLLAQRVLSSSLYIEKKKIVSIDRGILALVGFEKGDTSSDCEIIADKLLKEKVKNIEKVKPDIISTGNIGCITQISNGTKIPILHTAELIDWYTGGPKPKILSKL